STSLKHYISIINIINLPLLSRVAVLFIFTLKVSDVFMWGLGKGRALRRVGQSGLRNRKHRGFLSAKWQYSPK
ncbi:hypothetical protein, partial [Mycoplasmopsis arginini]|uniref:hypothetical protein n=1 Tax=Mycoplasmopsis arginini TaxID=2094 RepID=UPI00249E5272